MHYVIVDLIISADEMLRYYRGDASGVSTTARDGRSVRFPASALRDFVDSDGVNGSFAIYFDAENKLEKIKRLI